MPRLVSDMGRAVRNMTLEAENPAPKSISPSTQGGDSFSRPSTQGGASSPRSMRRSSTRSRGLLKALTAELQATGKYGKMREALAEAAVRVAIERYGKAHDAGVGEGAADGPTAEQVAALHEELHAVLTEELAAAFADAVAPSGGASASASAADPAASSSPELSRLLSLAAECEQAGLNRRAEALHQRRVLLLASSNASAAEAWCEYGAFCNRTHQHSRGEQCFREGLELERQQQGLAAGGGCLAALAGSLLHQGRVTDPLFLEEADGLIAELAAAGQGREPGGGALPAVLTALAREAQGSVEAAEAAVQDLVQLEASAVDAAGPNLKYVRSSCNPCMAVADWAVRLGLPLVGLSALALAEKMPLTAADINGKVKGQSCINDGLLCLLSCLSSVVLSAVLSLDSA